MPIVESMPATGGRRVALTFDDGPHERYTPLVLDALAAGGAAATFFVRGSALGPATHDIVRRAAAEGHDIGNHTHSHIDLAANPSAIPDEIRRAHDELESIIGRPPDLVRPPYGRGLLEVDTAAAQLGYRATVFWSVDPLDFENPPTETLLERIEARLGPGGIVLLHDGCDGLREEGPSYSPHGTVEALPALIDRLREHAYEPVTVTQLLDG